MSHGARPDTSHYYVPHPAPGRSWDRFAVLPHARAACLLNDWAGAMGAAFRATLHRLHVLRLVRFRHRRKPARHLQHAGRQLVPHGNDVVHLLRSDVLRAFFGALFYARSSRCRGWAAKASRSLPRSSCGRTTAQAGRPTVRATSAVAPMAPSRWYRRSACRRINTADPAHQRPDRDHCAPCARAATRRAEVLAGR